MLNCLPFLLGLVLPYFLFEHGGKGTSISKSSSSQLARDLILMNDFLPRKSTWHKIQRNATQKGGGTMEVNFDKQCKKLTSHMGNSDESFEAGVFLPLIDVLSEIGISSPGDRTGAQELTGVLRSFIAFLDNQGSNKSVYEAMKGYMLLAINRGLFRAMTEFELINPEAVTPFHHSRRVVAEAFLSFPDYYFRRGLGNSHPCPFAGAFPQSWYTRDKTGHEGLLEVMAVPAVRRKDGSFQITSPRFNISTFSVANELFFKENNWDVTDIRRPPEKDELDEGGTTLTSNSSMYSIEMSPEVHNCTLHYIFIHCRAYSRTPRDALCTEWGNLCGVRTAIELPTTGTNETTHMLYIPSKTVINNLGSDTLMNIKKRNFFFAASLASSSSLSRFKLSETLDLMERTAGFYLPRLEEDHDDLTFTVIVLVFLSEWMLSVSLIWSKLVDRLFGKVFGSEGRTNTSPQRRMKRRFTQGCALLLPALTGFVPLVIGLWQTAQRKQAAVGVLAASWGVKNFPAVDDATLESFGLAGGTTLNFKVEYREISAFDNLFSKYMIATCIAAVLLGFPIALLIFQGSVLVRTGRKS